MVLDVAVVEIRSARVQALITDANSGVGRSVALAPGRGLERLFLTGRNAPSGERSAERLRRLTRDLCRLSVELTGLSPELGTASRHFALQ